MASRRAVLAALTMFSRAFAGDVGPERVDLYAVALDDVSDEALAAAVVRLVREHEGEFIPTPAAIRRAAGANVAPVVDVEAVVRKIDGLGSYNPNTGWCSPRVEVVRRAMGDAVADAYGAVGGPSRLYGGDETGRSIALRDFGRELVGQVEARGPAALEPPPQRPLLSGAPMESEAP